MFSWKKALTSGVGRKLINGLTAIGLVIFVVGHILGNLTIFAGAGEFNAYGKFLHDFGGLFTALEVGLLAVFLFHLVTGLNLAWQNYKARSKRYQSGMRSKKGPSHFNIMSATMVVSGLVLLAFVVVHVLQMRFGFFADDAATMTQVDGEQARDLYGLAVHVLSQPFWMVFYLVGSFFLGWHIRHGLWSMLQTVGVMDSRWEKPAYAVSAVVSFVVAFGFLSIPPYVYFLA